MDPLVLHVDRFWISPYAMSAFVALEEKGLPYTIHEVSLADGEQHAPAYLARTGRVPALQHGDFWLAESQAIGEYLAESFPAPIYPRLFPANFKERGICRELQSWLRSDLLAIRDERSTHTMFYEHTDVPLSAAAQAAVTRLVKVADQLIGEGRDTLFASWCIADTDLAIMLQRLNLNGDTLPPKLKHYAEENWSRPAMRKWCEHVRPPYTAY